LATLQECMEMTWLLLQRDEFDGHQHNLESACQAKLSMPTQTYNFGCILA